MAWRRERREVDASDLSEEGLRKKARSLALACLSRREMSAGELRQALIRRGYPEEMAEDVVRRLVSDGYVNDERFTRIFVRDQAMKGKGPVAIRSRLKVKGVDLSVAEVSRLLKDEADVDEVETARKFVQRRYPGAHEDPKVATRAVRALLGRGFTYDVAKKVVRLAPDDDGG